MTLQPYIASTEITIQSPSLSQREYELLRDAMPTTRDQLICKVLRATGRRISEVLRCRVSEMVFNGPEVGLYLTRSKKRTEKPVYTLVPLPLGLGTLLRDYVKGNSLAPDQSIFGITSRQVERVFVVASMRALGRRAHPHELRGVYATDLIDGGVPIEAVAHLLGHANPRTTQEYYYRMNADKIRAIQMRVQV